MHPKQRKHLARELLGLSDFVFVVRKDQVLAAKMDVERLPEILHRHGGALNVPPWAAGANFGVPKRLAGFGRFPECEVAGIVLVVFAYIDASPIDDPAEIL